MNKHLQKKQLREFGLLIGIGFPLIIGLFIPYLIGHNLRLWTIFIGIPFLIFGIFKPYKLYFLYKKWIALGNLLGWFNSKIILGIIFFTILIPISILMKIFGYDPLKRKKLNVISYKINKAKNTVDLTKIF